MPLRRKLTITFFVLLLAPIVALSVFSLDRAVGLMVDNLGASGDLMSRQVFEEMRIALDQKEGATPENAFQNDESIMMLLRSIQAFGPAIVHARIVGPDGRIVVAATSTMNNRHQAAYPPFAELRTRVDGWWPLSMVPLLSGEANYEISRPVYAGAKLLAIISIGVTTDLIRAQIQRQMAITLTLMVAVSTGAVLSVFLLSKRLMRQLDAIAVGVERLAAGQTDVELTLPPQDELSALAQKFNQLSRRLRVDRSQWDANRTPLFDVVKSLNEAVMLLDDGGAILFANDTARSLLGLTSQGVIEGLPLSSLLAPAHPLIAMAAAALEGNTEARDVAIRLPNEVNGDRSSLLVSMFRLGQERKAAGLLIILRDLQPVRELENAIEDSNRLARLGGLISGVAHQLRNPLQGMNLRLELLAQEVKDTAGADRHIAKLRREVQRLDEAVEALLRFMRPQALELSDFSINELITEQATHIRRDDVRVEFGLDPSVPMVHGDRSMLGEALKNVVDNALQAMPEGGTLALKSRASGAVVEMTVSDTGEGIAPENLDRIFNLYFTTKNGGTGLGLPLALRAVELNRGTMELRSQPPNGTSCIIRVPILRPQ
jgi:two-component system sensor histidine kinase AtoS